MSIRLEGYDADDKIAYVIRTQKTFWEVDQLEYVAMVGPRGGIYLDVGSNIGNHTYSHSDLTRLKPAEISSQVVRGPRSRCVRPPFGATNPTVGRILAQRGLRQVLWTTDTKDWSRPGSKKIVKAATAPTVGAGNIVLMHDGGGDRSQTVAALPQIIATLQQRGYVVRRIPGC